jgi:hypothetical protein
MNRIVLIVLLLLIAVVAACVTVQQSACQENLTPSIIPGRNSYSRALSSVPGLPLSPDPGSLSACPYRYRWLASDGLFLLWDAQDFTVHEMGRTVETDNRTVYWTWYDDGLPISGRDVTITLEVLDPRGNVVLGRADQTIGWDGVLAVVK